MGEYEPRDSRIVTNNPSQTPIEPKRTGPRESETRTAIDTHSRQSLDRGKASQKSGEEDRWQADSSNTEERESPGSTGMADGFAGRRSQTARSENAE